MNTPNKDLTILLTLKGRPDFTFRWMSYADTRAFPFKILIADGGADQDVQSALSNKDNFTNIDYEYIRFPYDQCLTDYYGKVVAALTRVKTPFVVMTDNDILLIETGLLHCVNFLSSHSDYNSCRGICMPFSLTSWSNNRSTGNTYGDAFWPRFSYDMKSIEYQPSSERVRAHFLNYSTTAYDVFRTEMLKSDFEALLNINPKDIILHELIITFLNVAGGKVKTEPVLYLLRQGNAGESCSAGEIKSRDYFDRMLSESWSEDFTAYIKIVAQEVAKNDKISIGEISPRIKKWYRAYIRDSIIVSLSGDSRDKGFSLMLWYGIFKRKIGSFIIKILKTRFWKQQIYLMGVPRRYHTDINFIREFLSKPQNTTK